MAANRKRFMFSVLLLIAVAIVVIIAGCENKSDKEAVLENPTITVIPEQGDGTDERDVTITDGAYDSEDENLEITVSQAKPEAELTEAQNVITDIPEVTESVGSLEKTPTPVNTQNGNKESVTNTPVPEKGSSGNIVTTAAVTTVPTRAAVETPVPTKTNVSTNTPIPTKASNGNTPTKVPATTKAPTVAPTKAVTVTKAPTNTPTKKATSTPSPTPYFVEFVYEYRDVVQPVYVTTAMSHNGTLVLWEMENDPYPYNYLFKQVPSLKTKYGLTPDDIKEWIEDYGIRDLFINCAGMIPESYSTGIKYQIGSEVVSKLLLVGSKYSDGSIKYDDDDYIEWWNNVTLK